MFALLTFIQCICLAHCLYCGTNPQETCNINCIVKKVIHKTLKHILNQPTNQPTEALVVSPPSSPQQAGLRSPCPASSPQLSSPLLNADVLLTSAYNSAKMFNFGSKMLLVFLLAFPCGLMSIGKSQFSFKAGSVYLRFTTATVTKVVR